MLFSGEQAQAREAVRGQRDKRAVVEGSSTRAKTSQVRTEKGPVEVVSEHMSTSRKVVSIKRVEWSHVTPGLDLCKSYQI